MCQNSTAKFKVVHELEEHLPAALFDREWDHAQRGEGKAYKPLTHIEPYIPLVFVALYLILAVYAFTAMPENKPSPSMPGAADVAMIPAALLEQTKSIPSGRGYSAPSMHATVHHDRV